MNPPSRTRDDHLLTIARCPIVEQCLDAEPPRHACATIVLDQWPGVPVEERTRRWREVHQLPEPWEGHIETAPILFVSSNPSIRGSINLPIQSPEPADDSLVVAGKTSSEHPSVRRRGGPKWTWADDELVDVYESSFDLYISGGTKERRPDGSLARATRFWSSVKRRAEELIPHRPIRPGVDYALTEVVHCKSPSERGVAAAFETCTSRYLVRTLECAGAEIVVVLGRWGRIAFRQHFDIVPNGRVVHSANIAGRDRLVAFLPGPTAYAPRTFAALCSPDELQQLRSRLG